MLAAGVDIKIVSETLGHSETRITHDIYQSVMPKAAAEAAEATAAMVPRGSARQPVQEPIEQEAVAAPVPTDGHTTGTQDGAKILEFRPRKASA